MTLRGGAVDVKDTKLVGALAVHLVLAILAINFGKLDIDARFLDHLAPFFLFAFGGGMKVGETERAVEFTVFG